MKIVHLIDYYQPQVGYQEYFLASENAKAGHDTYVLTSNRYFPFPDYDRIYRTLLGNRYVGNSRRNDNGIKVIRLKSLELPGSNLIILQGLKNELRQIKPDLVICHGIYSLTSYLISVYKKTIGFKLIYDNHAAAFNTDFSRSISRRIYHLLFKQFLFPSIRKNAGKIFAIGPSEKDFICSDLGLPEKDIPVIRLAVDTVLFSFSDIARRKIRTELKISRNAKVVIFSGKITPNKDVHILVSALEKITEFNMTLLLVGNGPPEYLDRLKQLARNYELIHVPLTENKKLPLYFNAADIAVYPGDFTISVLEAMSCALPLILPEWYGTTDLKLSGGILSFKRGDARKLFKNLHTLVYNNSLTRDFGRKNADFIRKKYSWEKIAKETLELI